MLSSTSSPHETTQVDYKKYIIDTPVVNMRNGGRFNQSVILKFADGTEWIYLGNKPEERFCGFLYLQKALEESNFSNIAAAENKMSIHDRKIIYLSKYCGEKRPEIFDTLKKIHFLKNDIGFTDTGGCANLREEAGTLYVFDTEKGSFDKSVHVKIDLFTELHDAIKSSLEKQLQE